MGTFHRMARQRTNWLSGRASLEQLCGPPPGAPAEVGTLGELRPRGIALAVLGDVHRTGAGGEETGDHRAVLTLHLAVQADPQPAHGEPGIHGLAERQVVGPPWPGVLRLEPVRVLVQLRVLSAR